MTDYLSEFDELVYDFEQTDIHGDVVHLSNLKELGGMEVAELLTYLYDDGYIHKLGMFSDEANGALSLSK